MKRLACIVFVLCSATMACDGNDPFDGKKGRTVRPRLSGVQWRECCVRSQVRTVCKEKVRSRDEALALLVDAHGECLDKAFAAVETYAREDLPAAYFIRAERRDDPRDFLRALQAALGVDSDVARFNRALVQAELGLTREAIQSWNDVVKHDRSEEWKDEARRRLDALNVARPRWRPDELGEALRRRDSTAVHKIAREFPADAMRYFEASNVLDLAASRLLADALAASGDPYARAIVDAVARTTDRDALERGVQAFAEGDYPRAAMLLERAGNPLHLAARYRIASRLYVDGDPSPVLDSIAPVASRNHYRDLLRRTYTLRASAPEQHGRYLEALPGYEEALQLTAGDATTTVEVLTRRSASYTTIGDPEKAFRDSFAALSLLPAVGNLNARHQTYGTAAMAARALGYPAIALQYQNAAVDEIQKAIAGAPADALRNVKRHFAIVLRERASIHVELGHDTEAQADLEQARDLAEAAESAGLRDLLKMRLEEVKGQALLERSPERAAHHFTEAIALATQQHSTYRAVLHYKRAMARGSDSRADEDIAEALKILHDEATRLRETTARGAYESLWNPYFSRFQAMYRQMIERRLQQQDEKGAFVYAEQARAFEPLQLVLQAGPVPPGFRRIETRDDLEHVLATLPRDTVILQYLVLEDRTYSWALSRGGVRWARHRVGRRQIEEWVARVQTAVRANQNGPVTTVMRAVYEELFLTPLALPRHERIVIVPDGPMHGLPFAALESAGDGYLIQRHSIAVAGSTSLYLYALHRDRQFPPTSRPAVLVVGEPAIHPAIARQFELGKLDNAIEEARQLARDYAGAELLLGGEATTERFLRSAENADIIHFAGHGVANPRNPWLSMLVLAPQGKDAGDLTAEKLLSRLPDLRQTRFITLAACSTAWGDSVGAEGLAPLVRPLIAARVPAVVGTLWDVKDTATTKELLVSLHRHYRNGDDVAVALRNAQLEMLRKNKPARTWAPFQVVGHAASPYARPAALEETHSEYISGQNSLHRPDGLHSQ